MDVLLTKSLWFRGPNRISMFSLFCLNGFRLFIFVFIFRESFSSVTWASILFLLELMPTISTPYRVLPIGSNRYSSL